MQRFAYHRSAAALRSQVTMLLVLVAFELVVILVLSLLLRRPWNWVALGAGAVLFALAVWKATERLRTAHTLSADVMHLRFGSWHLAIPRAAITDAAPHREVLPPGLAPPIRAYRAAQDTFYLLAAKRGLVALTLDTPVEARTQREGMVQFTRLVLSLDEPEAFLAALGQGPVAPPLRPSINAPTSAETFTGTPKVELVGLSRSFGDLTAVGDLNLTVAPGEIVAFLGSNGAGKTTTIKMMTGLLRPTAGQVLIDGQDLWATGPQARRQIGYVPDVPLLYEGLTAQEFLWLIAGLQEFSPAMGRVRAEELLAQFGLQRSADQLIRTFSLGMKRKMAIAAALVHRPPVLLLDEVTNGLDPRAARDVKDFIVAAAQSGIAVFLTTHLLDLAQELAHRIAVIHHGRLRTVGTLAQLRVETGLPNAGLEQLFLALTEEVRVCAEQRMP